jgi:hypothetical protein
MRFYAQFWPLWVEQPEILGHEPSFGSPREAWGYLKQLRKAQEDEYPDWNIGEYTDTVPQLDWLAGGEEFSPGMAEFGNPHEEWPVAADGTGQISGATPGLGDHAWEDGIRDVGIYYGVVAR